MSQHSSNPQAEDLVPGANGAPQPDEQGTDLIGRQVTEDVGGVQGSDPDEDDAEPAAAATSTGSPPDQPAPDAGEIEWAGQVVKKPPTPAS